MEKLPPLPFIDHRVLKNPTEIGCLHDTQLDLAAWSRKSSVELLTPLATTESNCRADQGTVGDVEMPALDSLDTSMMDVYSKESLLHLEALDSLDSFMSDFHLRNQSLHPQEEDVTMVNIQSPHPEEEGAQEDNASMVRVKPKKSTPHPKEDDNPMVGVEPKESSLQSQDDNTVVGDLSRPSTLLPKMDDAIVVPVQSSDKFSDRQDDEEGDSMADDPMGLLSDLSDMEEGDVEVPSVQRWKRLAAIFRGERTERRLQM